MMKKLFNLAERIFDRVLWSDLSDHVRQDLEWLGGRHGPAEDNLPSLDDLPVPRILFDLPELHPDRPTGSKIMLDVNGARTRLAVVRPGAWLVSVFSGWKWAKWPSGQVGWVPKSIELPLVLRVECRNDGQR